MRNLYQDISTCIPNKTAIIYDDKEVSYKEFLAIIDRFAGLLIEKGAQMGERVALIGLNRLNFLAAVYGCFKVGVVAVPLDADDQVRAQAAMQNAKVRIVIDRLPETSVDSCVQNTQEAMIIFTSGTTSEGRKGVILGHEGIGSTADFMNSAMAVDSSIIECVYAPLDHAFAFGRCHAVLMAQGTLHLGKDPLIGYDSLFVALNRYQCNSLGIVPSVLSSLMKVAPKRFVEAAQELRWIQTGAMRFDKKFRDLLCESLPNCRIFLHYGLSEAMRATFFDLSSMINKRNTEGKAAEGVEIGIFGENGEMLGPDEEGIIAVLGRNLALGYTDQKLWQASYRDGWFFSSDRGKLDKDGYLIFVGRDDDVINTNGILVHPDEIETRLEALFPTQAFSVVGVDDPKGIRDKVIVLCVEGKTNVTITDVALILANSEQYMIPAQLRCVETLPRTHSGKVMRRKLASDLSEIMKNEIQSNA